MSWKALLASLLASATFGAVSGVQGWIMQQGGVVSLPKMEEATQNVVRVLGAEIAKLRQERKACQESLQACLGGG